MNFKLMGEKYVEMRESNRYVAARRRIWPPNVHVLLGAMTDGTPMAVVTFDAGGMQKPELMAFGMNLIMNGETMVFGWCPSIEDVMGQDWEFTKKG